MLIPITRHPVTLTWCTGCDCYSEDLATHDCARKLADRARIRATAGDRYVTTLQRGREYQAHARHAARERLARSREASAS
jgi:hypothetical protein